MRIVLAALGLVLLACGGEDTEGGPPADAPYDAAEEVRMDVEPPEADIGEAPPDTDPPCAELLPGSWRLSGGCVSMVLWFEATWSGCQLDLNSLTHPMGQPTSASVSGTSVTFHGGTWKGCSGTVIDAQRIDATCAVCAAGKAVGFTLLHAK